MSEHGKKNSNGRKFKSDNSGQISNSGVSEVNDSPAPDNLQRPVTPTNVEVTDSMIERLLAKYPPTDENGIESISPNPEFHENEDEFVPMRSSSPDDDLEPANIDSRVEDNGQINLPGAAIDHDDGEERMFPLNASSGAESDNKEYEPVTKGPSLLKTWAKIGLGAHTPKNMEENVDRASNAEHETEISDMADGQVKSSTLDVRATPSQESIETRLKRVMSKISNEYMEHKGTTPKVQKNDSNKSLANIERLLRSSDDVDPEEIYQYLNHFRKKHIEEMRGNLAQLPKFVELLKEYNDKRERQKQEQINKLKHQINQAPSADMGNESVTPKSDSNLQVGKKKTKGTSTQRVNFMDVDTPSENLGVSTSTNNSPYLQVQNKPSTLENDAQTQTSQMENKATSTEVLKPQHEENLDEVTDLNDDPRGKRSLQLSLLVRILELCNELLSSHTSSPSKYSPQVRELLKKLNSGKLDKVKVELVKDAVGKLLDALASELVEVSSTDTVKNLPGDKGQKRQSGGEKLRGYIEELDNWLKKDKLQDKRSQPSVSGSYGGTKKSSKASGENSERTQNSIELVRCVNINPAAIIQNGKCTPRPVTCFYPLRPPDNSACACTCQNHHCYSKSGCSSNCTYHCGWY